MLTENFASKEIPESEKLFYSLETFTRTSTSLWKCDTINFYSDNLAKKVVKILHWFLGQILETFAIEENYVLIMMMVTYIKYFVAETLGIWCGFGDAFCFQILGRTCGSHHGSLGNFTSKIVQGVENSSAKPRGYSFAFWLLLIGKIPTDSRGKRATYIFHIFMAWNRMFQKSSNYQSWM